MADTYRVPSIDALRFIGITCIILAHVLGPGSLLFQLRSFDVPLMVFVSGLVSARKATPNYGKYLAHRALRLMMPVWLFYTLYFAILWVLSRFSAAFSFPAWCEIGRTFLCLEGYGWIIRVFLLLMLVSPLLVRLEQRLTHPLAYLALIAGCLGLSAVLTPLFQGDSFLVKDLWEGCVLYLVGYAPTYLAGLRMRYASRIEQIFYAAVFTLAALAYFLRPGVVFDLEAYKWPPQIPFMLYGMAVSCLLWLCRPILDVLAKLRPVVFIGQNTIWIYLWHVMALLFVFKITDTWPIQYCFVLGASVTIFFIQYQLVKNKPKTSFAHKYLLG